MGLPLPTMRWVLLLAFCLHAWSVLAQPEGYSSIDGRGYRPEDPTKNALYTVYARETPLNSFEDGLGALNSNLPNPRMISNRLCSGVAGQSTRLTALHIGFGQLLSHDIQSTNVNQELDPTFEEAGTPVSIPIPPGDPWFDPMQTGNRSLIFFRNNRVLGTGTGTNRIRTTRNLVTPLLDLSVLYGVTEERMNALRNDTHPAYLKVSYSQTGETQPPWNTLGLFMSSVPRNRDPATLFASGSISANQNSLVLGVEILFLREHNRLVDELGEAHPSWSQDKLFWEARKFNIGKFQAIAYNEYIPSALGVALPNYNGYNPNTQIEIGFLFNIAFRFVHSAASSDVTFADRQRQITRTVRLRDAFFNPQLIDEEGANALIRGMMLNLQRDPGLSYIDDMRNFLFGPPGTPDGVDLAALEIWRCRDYGIPFYNDARQAAGLYRVESFSNLTSDVYVASVLQDIYGHPDNVEMLIGGHTEDLTDGNIGSLFSHYIVKQFTRLREGDYYYFENDPSYTEEERSELSRTTIADIILRNTDISALPCSSFYASDSLDCGTPNSPGDGASTNQTELLGGRMLLGWSIDLVEETITFDLEASTQGWVSIAIASNPGNMVGADAMIGAVVNGQATMRDYYMNGRSVGCPGVCTDAERGGTDDITGVSGSESGGKTYLRWTRKLDTGDSQDAPIQQGETTNIIVAMSGSDSLGYHGANKGAASINFFTGDVDLSAVDVQNDKTSVIIHAVFMFVAWTVIFPLGVVTVRFCRKILPRWWFRLHMFIQYFGVLMIIVALILAVEVAAPGNHEHIDSAHSIVGLIAIGLAIIVPALGQATAVMYEVPKRVPIFPDRAHAVLGYLSPFVAYAAIFLGLDLYDTPWYWYLLVALWIGFITIAYWTAFFTHFAYIYFQSKQNQAHNAAISAEEEEDSWSSDEE